MVHAILLNTTTALFHLFLSSLSLFLVNTYIKIFITDLGDLSKLRFMQHINETCTKARGIRAALYPMLNHHNPILIKKKLAIIKMYMISILTYAGPAWGAMIAKHRWKQLKAIKSIVLWTIIGLPKYVRNTAVRNTMNI